MFTDTVACFDHVPVSNKEEITSLIRRGVAQIYVTWLKTTVPECPNNNLNINTKTSEIVLDTPISLYAKGQKDMTDK